MPALADVSIGARIPAAIKARLEAAAERENNRVSAVLRRLLTDALDREDAARKLRERPRKRS